MTVLDDTSSSITIQRAVDSVCQAIPGIVPKIGIVLGSGLGGLVDAIEEVGSMPYSAIPGFPESTVEGHDGRLVLGTLGGVPVAAMKGRVHQYEGYSPRQVVFPVRVLVRLGASTLVVTNASGGVNAAYDARDLMLLSDHLNLTGSSPLTGPNDPALGPRFPDMTDAYDLDLRRVAREVARRQGLPLHEGVYAGLLGPAYETPAEIRMLRAMGADAVGMSTVHEVIAARHMGARVLGISCISNKAAGLSGAPLSHEEVKEAGVATQARLVSLVTGVVEALGNDAAGL